MSFGLSDRSGGWPFDDGERCLVEFADRHRAETKTAIVKAGIARRACASDAPGVDVRGRLKLVDWPTVEPGSVEHRRAAEKVGDLIRLL